MHRQNKIGSVYITNNLNYNKLIYCLSVSCKPTLQGRKWRLSLSFYIYNSSAQILNFLNFNFNNYKSTYNFMQMVNMNRCDVRWKSWNEIWAETLQTMTNKWIYMGVNKYVMNNTWPLPLYFTGCKRDVSSRYEDGQNRE